MAIWNRPRFAVSVAAGILVFAGSLAAMRAGESYQPVFRSCAANKDQLVIAAGTDTSVNHQRQQLISQWNAGARGNDLPARIVEVADIADLRHSQLMAAEQSGSCGYDALMLDVIWTAEFARDGLIRPITSGDINDQEGFIPSVLKTGQWNGQQYAVPYSTNVGLLYYRKGGSAPPDTWDGLVSRGYAGQLDNYEGLTVNALEAIWNDGDSNVLTSTSTHVTPETVKTKILPALDKLARTARKGNNPLYASRAFDETKSQNYFADRQAALLRDWPDAYRSLAADPRQWTAGGDPTFGVKPLPGGYGALGGDNLAIATASRHPKQVLDLINFLTSKTSEDRLFACAGVAPARWAALTSSASCPQDASAAASDAEPGHMLSPEQDTQFTNELIAALSNALPRPVTPYYTAFSTTFRGCVEKVLKGHSPTPAEFAGAVNAALAGNGTYRSCRA